MLLNNKSFRQVGNKSCHEKTHTREKLQAEAPARLFFINQLSSNEPTGNDASVENLVMELQWNLVITISVGPNCSFCIIRCFKATIRVFEK